MEILIAGCGIAGVTAAKKIRELDPCVSVTLIDREGRGLYSRMRLPEVLAGKLPENKLILSSPASLASLKINTICAAIDSFDPKKKTAHLSNGTTLKYDKLILAVGADASLPPIPGALPSMTLRTMEDLERLLELMRTAKSATVIGGGLLGLEAANALHERGMQVAIVECMSRLLPRQLTEKESELLLEKFQEAGYQIHTDRKTVSIQSENGGFVVSLDNGEVLRSDMVIISAGIRPAVELAKNAGAETGRAIPVNSKFETSLQDVYAIGDCAQMNGISYGLWIASKEQGEALAEILCGKRDSFLPPVYEPSLKIPGIKLKEIRTAAQKI